MRFFNFFVLLFLLSVNAKAQQNHFVYIQTENKQAFYVKINEKILSSSASGYIIIPKLPAAVYKLMIGFPKNEWPAQYVDLTINDHDEGFLLKNFAEKGWGLFNIQTMDLNMAIADNNPRTFAPTPKKTDAFSSALAEVSNTTFATDSIQSADTTRSATNAEKERTGQLAPEPARQLFSILDNTGRSILYAIPNEINPDTVRIFIPYDHADTIKSAIEKETTVKTNEATNIIGSGADSVRRDSMVTDISPAKEIQKPVETRPVITDIKISAPDSNANTSMKVTIINPDCKSVAANDDFLKLRKKMAAADNDEAMLVVAKKGFKSNCFTTEQVKNLSLLFLKDEGKYSFYDVAYKHVTDIGNFKDLQSQLTEEYYINRFKAMLH